PRSLRPGLGRSRSGDEPLTESTNLRQSAENKQVVTVVQLFIRGGIHNSAIAALNSDDTHSGLRRHLQFSQGATDARAGHLTGVEYRRFVNALNFSLIDF